MTNTEKPMNGKMELWSGSERTCVRPPTQEEAQQRYLETTLASSAPLMELLLRAALLCASTVAAMTLFLTRNSKD